MLSGGLDLAWARGARGAFLAFGVIHVFALGHNRRGAQQR